MTSTTTGDHVPGAREPSADFDVGPEHLRETAATWVRAVLWRPWLWPVAVAEALRMAGPRWWRRWPPLPVPDSALWRFRMETAYGPVSKPVPTTEDVRAFLQWCREAYTWRKR